MAAGASRRLGQPKQLLPFRGTVLVNYVVQQALASKVGPVFVVLGAQQAQIRPRIDLPDEQLLYCENWAEGMGTTIAYGVHQLLAQSNNGLLISVADQPFLTADILQQLVQQRTATGASVVCSKYAEGQGPPTFFSALVVPELLHLRGDDGAKQVVKRYRKQLATINFPSGCYDVDTEADLIHLISD